jgi:DNA-binding transcriptional LysR family regulator
MDLRVLRYFVAVAEELNFSRAAARMNIAQPPLSQQIKRLETELGVLLLERTKRRVALTEAGRALLVEARATLEQARRCVEVTHRANRGELGSLSLGFVPAADLRVLPSILPVFKSRYPEVKLSAYCLANMPQLEALRAGQIDAGIFFQPIDLRLGEERQVKIEKLLTEPTVLALPVAHRLTKQKRIAVRDLYDEKFVLYRRDIAPAFYDTLMAYFRQAGFSPIVVQESDNVQTIAGLVACGLGIAFLPRSALNVRRETVIYRALQAPAPSFEMVIAYKPPGAVVLQRFLEIARNFAAIGFPGTERRMGKRQQRRVDASLR